MHVLFVHKNFPAQFGHVAQWLVGRHKWKATYVSELPNAVFGGLKRVHYKPLGGAREETHFCSRSFENFVAHSQGVHHALKRMPDIKPDLIVGHSGFGSTAFLPELYDCPIINYFEWFYHSRGTDMDFRPEFPPTELANLRARARNAMLLLDLNTCDAGYSPTEWQRSQFPEEYLPKIETIFDGIDTGVWRRQEQTLRSVAGRQIPAGAKVVTYVSRGFEAMRGFDVFMRVAKRIAAERKDVVFIVVGQDRVCYGNDATHTGGMTLKEQIFSQGGFDTARFIFPGQLPTAELANVLSLSDLHIYLTVPFVLSWSLMNAMACGCTILASDTAPVREVIEHGANGLLAPFADEGALTAEALRVLDAPAQFQQLGANARATVEQRYSTEVCLPKLEQMFRRVAGR
jgi:glycosyltransferase involved in cell wall biosynthesis